MPGTHEHPPVPPTSGRATPQFRDAAQRARAGATFDSDLSASADGATGYHRVRPGYPSQVIDSLRRFLPAGTSPTAIADIGAGTGKLTAPLADAFPGAAVTAVEPSEEMRRALALNCPGAEITGGTAEATGLKTASVDVAACAQTWHWVDTEAATAEFARILAPGGIALLVWNTLDVSVPWVHRLSRIMHAGDILRPGFYPAVGKQLGLAGELRCAWEQTLTIDDIVLLARTRSYWLRSKESVRQKVEANLHWYLAEHLGHGYDEGIALPYRCDAFYYRAAG
nr:class I SAM-dependent methyltransferase [Corynebacterium lactis]